VAARQALTPSRGVQSDEVDRRDPDAAVTILSLDGSKTAVDSPPRSTSSARRRLPASSPWPRRGAAKVIRQSKSISHAQID
jgi:hypothetical protein